MPENDRTNEEQPVEPKNPAVSFVFPCLNEERTIGQCIEMASSALEQLGPLRYEIVVADNGSEDASSSIAASKGAKVVSVEERGYGAALRAGFGAAEGEWIIMADADGTYPCERALDLYHTAIRSTGALVMGTRRGLSGTSSIPMLHRLIGTPALTWLINQLFRGRITDCNSGFRCFRKEALQRWQLRASGMELASEMIIRALKSGDTILEIPIELKESSEGRASHLETWNDGMRHLLYILSEKPSIFERFGWALLVLTSLTQVLAMVLGPFRLGSAELGGPHSQLLLLLGGIGATQCLTLSWYMMLRSETKPKFAFSRWALRLRESHLLAVLLLSAFSGVMLLAFLLIYWTKQGFHNLDAIGTLVFCGHFLGITTCLCIGLLALPILRYSEPYKIVATARG